MPRKDVLNIGYEFASISNVATAICSASESGYNRFYVPITHPRYKREFKNQTIIDCKGDNFSRSIVAVYPYDCIDAVIGKLSDYWNVDAEDENFRQFSENTLDQEIRWCIYLGIQIVMFSLPANGPVVNLARIIFSKLKLNHAIPTFLVRIPMISSNCASAIHRGDSTLPNDSWERWNSFRIFCGSDKKLKIALEISEDLPDTIEIEQWFGEPLGCVILKTKIFLTNQAGYPTLSKAHQLLVSKLLSRRVQIVISGASSEETRTYYQQYIQHLWQLQVKNDIYSQYTHGYEDFLQIPLQPLMDNLDRYTYEIFEKDPVKYRDYQRAICLALLDRKTDEENQPPIVIMVVGAGRGPLVNASLDASDEANVPIKVYAVEKNPFALVSLQTQKLESWKDKVTVVSADMRSWRAPEKADILVSELLGSFGDNELSPECLDGAQKFLKDDGISIPASYTSYICPTQTHKIYSEIIDFFDKDKPYYQRFEQPYVVHLQTVHHLAPVQKLFTFFHPNKDEIINNTRYERLTFEIEKNCVLHGFSGFFDTILYKDVKLSILPETYSEGMFSWFPIFFPIKEPVQVRKGEKIELGFWRLKNGKIVWYEWLVSAPVSLAVHNPNGRSYFIGLT